MICQAYILELWGHTNERENSDDFCYANSNALIYDDTGGDDAEFLSNGDEGDYSWG